jgi:hypothetical protein
MSSERPEEFSEPSGTRGRQPAADDRPDTAGDATRGETTVLVHGETISSQQATLSAKDSASQSKGNSDAARPEATIVVRGEISQDQKQESPSKNSPTKDKEKSPSKEVSAAKVKLQNRLPALDDDAHVGAQREHVVTRDGKADLSFTGTLVASAAPSSAPKGNWQEYRIYATDGGKHVFSKVTRSVYADEEDRHEAEVFDPSPSSMPSQLLRSARDLARARPLTWTDAAVAFFGYDPLAKTLYRKLSGQFEEHIA